LGFRLRVFRSFPVAPLRVSGSVTGTLNNVNITDVDIQTYAMLSDGRIYTALTRVPPQLGRELEIITAFVNSVGWLFAKRDVDAPNGFSLTGNLSLNISKPYLT